MDGGGGVTSGTGASGGGGLETDGGGTEPLWLCGQQVCSLASWTEYVRTPGGPNMVDATLQGDCAVIQISKLFALLTLKVSGLGGSTERTLAP